MRNFYKIIFITLLVSGCLLTFTKCKVNEADIKGGLPYVVLSLTDTTLAKTEQMVTIPVETNRPLKVDITSNYSEWIVGQVTDGVLTLTVNANDLETTRVATITLSSTNSIASATITVTQDASGELTITGDLILKSKAEISSNTYTKTTRSLILGDVVSIGGANAPQTASASSGTKVSEFGDSIIVANHSDIDNASLEQLTSQIHEVRGGALVVTNTEVSEFPLELISANGIKRVYFDHNKMTTLPSSTQLASLGLVELSIRGNQVTDISPLAECTTLTHLDLSETAVYDLSTVLSLSNIKTLKLEGAPISVTQFEIFKEKRPDIVADTTNIDSEASPLPAITIINVEEVSETSFKVTAKMDLKSGGQPTKMGFFVGKGRAISEMQFVEGQPHSDGTFSATITGDILSNNIYFFRGYAANNVGEGYSAIDYYGSKKVQEDIYLKSKEDLEKFFNDNISHIEGSLFIGKAEGTHSNQAVKLTLADTVLYFGSSDIDDLNNLRNLVYVKEGIYIANTLVSDISQFANIENAGTIWVKGNKIASVPDFSKVEGLESVDVSRNSISDIKTLLTSNIASLYLGDSENPSSETNNIGILNGLEGMTSLRYLDLSGLPIHKWQVDSLKAKMTGCEIKFVSGGREPMLPTVSNKSIKYADNGGVILYGYLDKAGANTIVEHGFYYGKDIKSMTKVKVGDNISASSEYSAEISVADSAKYYYQAYAINSLGESHSETIGEFSLSAIDLSAAELANCYIVSNAGRYTFNPHIIGNGKYGIIKGAGFHIEDVEINPVSAKLLWEEKEGMITEVSYRSDLKDVIFTSNGAEGNAVIAVCDADGTILWSWHIWCTDAPKEQTYVNSAGIFYVLDRNVGATRADRGSTDQDLLDSKGMLYFWGRKDPFNGTNHIPVDNRRISIEESISNPMLTHSVGGWSGSDSWMNPFISQAWSEERKTIYDPCPVGYKVATNAIWAGFTTTSQKSDKPKEFNVLGSFNSGWNFYIDETRTTTAWYPAHYVYWPSGKYIQQQAVHICWSVNKKNNADRSVLEISAEIVDPASVQNSGCAISVRCVKDIKLNNPPGGGEGYTGDEYEW